MKITFKQTGYNQVSLTLSAESLDAVLDLIGENQIEVIEITLKKPKADDEVH